MVGLFKDKAGLLRNIGIIYRHMTKIICKRINLLFLVHFVVLVYRFNAWSFLINEHNFRTFVESEVFCDVKKL